MHNVELVSIHESQSEKQNPFEILLDEIFIQALNASGIEKILKASKSAFSVLIHPDKYQSERQKKVADKLFKMFYPRKDYLLAPEYEERSPIFYTVFFRGSSFLDESLRKPLSERKKFQMMARQWRNSVFSGMKQKIQGLKDVHAKAGDRLERTKAPLRQQLRNLHKQNNLLFEEQIKLMRGCLNALKSHPEHQKNFEQQYGKLSEFLSLPVYPERRVKAAKKISASTLSWEFDAESQLEQDLRQIFKALQPLDKNHYLSFFGLICKSFLKLEDQDFRKPTAKDQLTLKISNLLTEVRRAEESQWQAWYHAFANYELEKHLAQKYQNLLLAEADKEEKRAQELAELKNEVFKAERLNKELKRREQIIWQIIMKIDQMGLLTNVKTANLSPSQRPVKYIR